MVLDSTDSVKAGYIGPSDAILYDGTASDIDRTEAFGVLLSLDDQGGVCWKNNVDIRCCNNDQRPEIRVGMGPK